MNARRMYREGRPLFWSWWAVVIAGALPVGLTATAQIGAQALPTAGSRLSFEVATVKLNKSRTGLPGIHLFDNRFNATSSALGLISWAYGHDGHPLGPAQISGGPDWIKSELFDVNAKVDDSLVEGEWKKYSFQQKSVQTMLMLQSLLADRFKLKVEHGTRVLPVYGLVLAKNGPKFKEDDTHLDVNAISFHGWGKLEATSTEMSTFASVISSQPELGGRIVLDKTGLAGHYSFMFQWVPENLGTRGAPVADNATPPEPSGPSLFTALQEQLGLKLVPIKAPVDVIVIEHIERPSEN